MLYDVSLNLINHKVIRFRLNLVGGTAIVRGIFGPVIFLTFLPWINALALRVIFHVGITFVGCGFFSGFSSLAIFVRFILTSECAAFSFEGFALKTVNGRFHSCFQLSKSISKSFLTILSISAFSHVNLEYPCYHRKIF